MWAGCEEGKEGEPLHTARGTATKLGIILPLLGSFLFAEPIFRTKDRRGMNLQ